MVVYVDVLLIINFIITYFLLLAAALISGYTYKRKRIIVSAIFGAMCCLYIFVQFENRFLDFAFKLVSLAVCSILAFGIKNKKKLIIQTLYFVALNALLTGVMTVLSVKSSVVYHNNLFFYLAINPVMLVMVSAVIYAVLLLTEIISEKISVNKCCKMSIVFREFALQDVSAFYDSGFKVKDIVSNKDVIIVSYLKLKDNLPKKIKESIENFMSQKYDEVECLFVPVMFNTLAGDGMLPSMKAEYIEINGKRIDNILVAFTASCLSENVDVIFGLSVRRQL